MRAVLSHYTEQVGLVRPLVWWPPARGACGRGARSVGPEGFLLASSHLHTRLNATPACLCLFNQRSNTTLLQFLKQMYVLVLGLDVLGNPFGLIRGLSEGVEAFFYEPFQVNT